jgi:opacity protein-like surface antigen
MKAILIVITLFAACTAQAQMDVVVLKNGSEIRGVVEKTTETIKLKTKDGSIWVFKKEEVEDIQSFRPVTSKEGYYGTISAGILGGSSVSGNLSFVNGYRINEHWSAGIGIGAEVFYDRLYMPLFVEGRYNLIKKGTTPFVSLGFGYDFPFEFTDRNRGGFFGQGFLGFQHELGAHFGIMTGIGYRYGQLEVEDWSWWNGESSLKKTIYEINRFDLRFGFIFR